jgi:hypothetical protein
MTPIETTEEFLGHLNLSDEDLREARDVVDELAEAIIRGYWARHKIDYAKEPNVTKSTGVSE